MTIRRGGYAVDYREIGSGPTIVLVPGSYSSTAAWGAVIERLAPEFRLVATSLLGTGGTEERRDGPDVGLAHQCDAIDAVIEKAGEPVHLVGHSWGAVAVLMMALTSQREVRSLTLLDVNAAMVLRGTEDAELCEATQAMGAAFAADWHRGVASAAQRVIDFFTGPDSFDALPPRVQDYVIATTPANLRDWEAFRQIDWRAADLAELKMPCLFIWGERSHPVFSAVARHLAAAIPGARRRVVEEASHFLITTHPDPVADLIRDHVSAVEAGVA